jgi:hypothetical protein
MGLECLHKPAFGTDLAMHILKFAISLSNKDQCEMNFVGQYTRVSQCNILCWIHIDSTSSAAALDGPGMSSETCFGSDLAMLLLEICHQPEPKDQCEMNLVGQYMRVSQHNIPCWIHIDSTNQCSSIGWARNVFRHLPLATTHINQLYHFVALYIIPRV